MQRLVQSLHATEARPPDSLAGQDGEEQLHQVQPGGRCGGEVEVVSWPAREPTLHLLLGVGAVVVQDQMDVTRGIGPVNQAQELQELLVAMPLRTGLRRSPVGSGTGR